MDVSKSAMEMMLLLEKANLKSLNAAQVNFWDEQMDAIALFLKKMAASKDLKVQRNEFYPLSQDLYDLYIQIGLKNFPVYKQYCPMAFKNKGAFWLSNSEEVLNPYFGSEMLHCGEIKEKIFNP
jgi:Cu(I)/Ag(I) efflux system membrane fusion protein